ncbi:serine hydrolase domain-containing protein [Cellvibrio japonicus]|uniref:Beta-lactamase n=1 Tax=Cellvibrio japonicus (strain Ueda107) TaxID=498211 RepID=B3PC44_CELJU|nr:serine hydrolase domain-containing protein [Cellvibrio japonicus]ACE85181.1 beta-lactamase [Cellvibrio japonicus Ueda107]QEI13193.1 beta-lactamase family protein [Cellvibrio japonicus]QEI16767.1 beta-lactamase family protein [Cellvibrio japonicus]QEI20345.1 beta-lactamase family protein [Cellvibrio japonicus]
MRSPNTIIYCVIIIFIGSFSFFSAIANEIESPMETWSKARASSDFSGSVLIVKGDDILFEKGFGLADKESNQPFTADTVVDVLSLTKQFTAAAILKLEEQGVLSVSDTLDRFFDKVPEDKKNITLHHLLTHTSGLKGDYKWDYRKVTREELEKNALNSWLHSEPGEKYHYSNVGYSLLGIIIEKASGKGYEEFLYEQFFKPAGMNHTGYIKPEWESKNLAVGYRSRAVTFRGWLARTAYWLGANDRWGTPLDQYWAKDGPWWNLRANGGLLSTLNDLHRWHLALENNLVLSEKSKRKLFTPHVNAESQYYGYGWHVEKNNDAETAAIYHTGGNPYFFSLFYRDINSDVLLLFVTNDWNSVDSGSFYGLSEAMEAEYFIQK